MKEKTEKEALEVDYLLGKASEDDRSRLEERYFAEQDAFEELEIAEEELVDAYLADLLAPGDRERFEQRLIASPRLLEKTRLARTLAQSLSIRRAGQLAGKLAEPVGIPTENVSWWRAFFKGFSLQPVFGVASVAFAVLLIGSVTVTVQWARLRAQSNSLTAERDALQRQKQALEQQAAEQRSRTEQLKIDLERQREQYEKIIAEAKQGQNQATDPSPLSKIAVLVLSPAGLRGGGARELTLKPDTPAILLTLILDANDYPLYSVSIRDSANKEVFHREVKPRSDGAALVFRLPAPAEPGDYSVGVSSASSGASEPVSNYSFRLIKQK